VYWNLFGTCLAGRQVCYLIIGILSSFKNYFCIKKNLASIKFIGTGSGRTSLKRNHSSLLISVENYNLLVDAGDGVSKALLSLKVDYNSIDGILFSHLHPDHYTGLPSLIVQMKMNKREKDLKIFIHEGLQNIIQDFIYRSYLFPEKLKFEINFEKFVENKTVTVSDSLNFIAKQNSHLDEYLTFADKEKLSFFSPSFLFNTGGKNIYYSGDISSKEDMYLFSDYKLDLMISEITHIEMKDLIEAFRKLNPKKLFLTHIGEKDENSFINIKKSLTANECNRILLASDGFIINLQHKPDPNL